MYRKVLVPLDGSAESEKTLPIVKDILGPMGEVVLLQVVKGESQATAAMAYLQSVGRELLGELKEWRPEVKVGGSVFTEVLDLATKEGVDFIAIYQGDGNRMVNAFKGGTTENLRLWSPVEVKVFGPKEMVPSGHSQSIKSQLLNDSDVFKALTDEQKEQVASSAQWLTASPGQELVSRGEVGRSIFIINSGDVRLSTTSPVGELTVRVAGPGESFPLAALVGDGTLVTGARALTETQLLELPRAPLIELCFSHPEIGVRVYSAVANVFANRYSKTLNHLGKSAQRELQGAADFLANI